MLCCETRSVALVVIIILKNTAVFQVLFIVSLFPAWNIATVEINSGFYLLKIKLVKCFCLLPVVLVVLSCKQRSWSCYFGLGLSFKNLVLFTSLPATENMHFLGEIPD